MMDRKTGRRNGSRVFKLGMYAGVIMLGMSGCGGPDPKVEACVERGIAYFKEIGSYPTLDSPPNKGRSAESVARQRCNRTPTAF